MKQHSTRLKPELLVICLIVGMLSYCFSSSAMPPQPNLLKNIKLHSIGFSKQVCFKFAGPFEHRSEVTLDGMQLWFPHAKVTNAKRINYQAFVTLLKDTGLISDIIFKTTPQGVQVSFSFTKDRTVMVGPLKVGTESLIVELYARSDLEKIHNAIDGPLFNV